MTRIAAPAAGAPERALRFIRTGSSLLEVRVDLLISLICALAVTAPILIHGTPDEETYEFSVF